MRCHFYYSGCRSKFRISSPAILIDNRHPLPDNLSKHMKKIFGFIFLAVLSFSAGAEEIPTVAILDFAVSDVSRQEMILYLDYLSTYINNTKAFRLIDRSQRDAILAEQGFSLADCTDENCQLEVGRLLVAEYLIVGSIGKVGSRYLLNLKYINVSTGEAEKTASYKYNSLDDLVDASEQVAVDFAGENGTALESSQIEDTATEAAVEPNREDSPGTEVIDEPSQPVYKRFSVEVAIGAFGLLPEGGDLNLFFAGTLDFSYNLFRNLGLGTFYGYPSGGLQLTLGSRSQFAFGLRGCIFFHELYDGYFGVGGKIYLKNFSLAADFPFPGPHIAGSTPPRAMQVLVGYSLSF